MDHVSAHGRQFPSPFHTRNLQMHHHPFQFQQQQLPQNSEDEHSGNSLKGDRCDDDNNKNTTELDKELVSMTGSDSHEGSNRRPRGRPAGSKNKPKPPIIITTDSANALRSHVMKIANGCDIHESVTTFATRRQHGFCTVQSKKSQIKVTKI